MEMDMDMDMKVEKEVNFVTLSGVVDGEPRFIKSPQGNFFETKLNVKRWSNTIDRIPIRFSADLPWKSLDLNGKSIKVRGNLHSESVCDDEIRHTNFFVLVTSFTDHHYLDDNFIFLDGYICKNKPIRKTPVTEREISDFTISVCREDGSGTDYIPCIAWGFNARRISRLPLGIHITVKGRIQSRIYQKMGEDKTTYEVSLFNYSVSVP